MAEAALRLSFLFNSHTAAQNLLLIVYLFTGGILMIVTIILAILPSTKETALGDSSCAMVEDASGVMPHGITCVASPLGACRCPQDLAMNVLIYIFRTLRRKEILVVAVMLCFLALQLLCEPSWLVGGSLGTIWVGKTCFFDVYALSCTWIRC